MKEIERAIRLIKEVERLQSKGVIDLTGIGDDENEFSHQGLCDLSYDLHQLLQSELARLENKALTEEDLENMIGEPVWFGYGKAQKLQCGLVGKENREKL